MPNNLDYLNEISAEDQLDYRELKEIDLARAYMKTFNHGTSGHMAYTVIAKLIVLMNIQHEKIKEIEQLENWKHDAILRIKQLSDQVERKD